MNEKIITFSIIAISCMFILSNIPNSEATLWDYVIDIELNQNPISEGKNVVLIGTVVDHAYRPVSNVDVKISFAGDSYMVKTDRHGEFGKQLNSHDLKPRTYTIHILATTDDEKKGMARTALQIDGHTPKTAKYERQLEFMEMVNDSSKLRKNSNDPISVILYEHYLQLQENVAQTQYEERLLEIPQQKIRDAQKLAHEKLMQSLEKRPLITSQFDDSSKLSKFLKSLDSDKRTLFELQLNSTMTRFIEAKIIMNDILISGGTQNEARQAYLDYLSITQEEMSTIIKNLEKAEISSTPARNSTEN